MTDQTTERMTEQMTDPASTSSGRHSIRAFIGLPLPAELRASIWSAARRLEAQLGAGPTPKPDDAKPDARAKPDVKWIRKPENLHVTLKFLGQIAVSRLDALTSALTLALADVSPFEARISGFGAFPDPAEATVIWASVIEDASGSLTALADTVARTAIALGASDADSGPVPGVAPTPPRAGRRSSPLAAVGPFRAHVTVGRCRRPFDVRLALRSVDSQEFGAFAGTFAIEAVDLYESILAVTAAPGMAQQAGFQEGSAEGSTYVLRGRAGLRGPRRPTQPSP
jgi:2'-5' RNA ligase